MAVQDDDTDSVANMKRILQTASRSIRSAVATSTPFRPARRGMARDLATSKNIGQEALALLTNCQENAANDTL